MGKLYITGKAKQELKADMVNIHLHFRITDKNSAKALYDVTEQCERFLGKLKAAAFDLNKIRLADDRVELENYTEGKPYSAQRTIEFDMPLEIKSYNALLDMIRTEQYEVSINTKYYVSNIDEVRERLVREAVLDSKSRAEKIAEAMGTKVTGSKEINVDGARSMVNPKYSDENDDLIPPFMLSSPSMENSDQLGVPIIEEEKSVSVTWMIE